MTVFEYSRAELEAGELKVWGAPCKCCGFAICECPVYRFFEGGFEEKMRRRAMNEHRHSRAMAPNATNVMFAPDIEERLLAERNTHADIARTELRNDPPNYAIVNEHDAMALLYYEAAETIRRLKAQNAAMAMTLRGRQ